MLDTILKAGTWLLENWQVALAGFVGILTAIIGLLTAVIGVCLLIPGAEPEGTLQKVVNWFQGIVDFLAKFSKK